jgi:cytoskeletal protein RodZ
MLPNFGILAVLVILVIIFLLALGLLAWYLITSSKPKPPESKTDAKANVKTEPVVQNFISGDLKKRAFIVRQNEGGFKVVFQQYSNKVINRGGEVAGWQPLPEQPVTDSLASAVEIAQNWVHARD